MLETKAAVNWDVCEAIDAAQPTIAKVYLDAKAKAVVTSARDGKHSKQTAHDDGNAIDLRIVNLFPALRANIPEWYFQVLMFAHGLAESLGSLPSAGRFDVVLERDHIHLEHSVNREPNIVNWKPERFVYVHTAVRAILDPKVGI
jgi:hypothetical protein